MCKIMEDMRNEVMEEAVRKTTLEHIKGFLKTTSLSFDQIAVAMNLSTEDKVYYNNKLQELI